MIDVVKLYLKAGDGGNGRVSFFRNRRVLKGGPDGGNGGNGGDITVEVDDKLNTLQHFSGKKRFVATDGYFGGQANKIGKNGENIALKVPKGTVVWLIEENAQSWQRRKMYGLQKKMSKDEIDLEKYYLEKETQALPRREKDEIATWSNAGFLSYLTKQVETVEAEFSPVEDGQIVKVAVLNNEGDKLTLVQGGFGGRGNAQFKSSIKTTPLEAEFGSFGEQKLIFLELRLLANVGLVGLPNAGKSSLLNRLTQAKPRVANYPFTTLEPNLGILKLTNDRNLVIADIPGIVEGAHTGKGLGFSFLRHIQNSQLLVFVLSLPEADVFNQELNNANKAEIIFSQFVQIKTEMQLYQDKLTDKLALIVVNKADLYDVELKKTILDKMETSGEKIIFTSTVTGEGLEELKQALGKDYQRIIAVDQGSVE